MHASNQACTASFAFNKPRIRNPRIRNPGADPEVVYWVHTNCPLAIVLSILNLLIGSACQLASLSSY